MKLHLPASNASTSVHIQSMRTPQPCHGLPSLCLPYHGLHSLAFSPLTLPCLAWPPPLLSAPERHRAGCPVLAPPDSRWPSFPLRAQRRSDPSWKAWEVIVTPPCLALLGPLSFSPQGAQRFMGLRRAPSVRHLVQGTAWHPLLL